MKDKIKNIISIISFILLTVFIILLININILPIKYLIPIIIFLLILEVLGIYLINYKKENKVLYIISIIILSLNILIGLTGTISIINIDNILNSTFNKDIVSSTEFYLVTSKENNVTYNKLTKSTNINYYKYSKNIDLAKTKLGSFNYIETTNALLEVLAIKQNNKLLLIDKNNYLVLFNDTSLNKKDYKIIQKIRIVTKEKRNSKVEGSYNIYIGGRDFTRSLMDFNMLITVNNKTHKILLTSIPRDYYVDVVGYNTKDSFEFMGLLGDEVSMKSLANLLDTPINNKVTLYTDGLVETVDKIGGIEFCSNEAFYTTHSLVQGTYVDNGNKLYVRKGCQELNGIETLTVSRERKNITGGDSARQRNCRQIAMKIIEKVLKTINPTNYNEVIGSFDGLYETNINKETMTNLVKGLMEGKYNVEEQELAGTGSRAKIRLNTVEDFVMIPNTDSVNEIKERIKSVLNEK